MEYPIVTFIVINSNVLDSNYSMLFRHPWLRDAKVSHDWWTNTITIKGIGKVKTIPITKKLDIQTKRPKVLVCYDFYFAIFDDEEDVMLATKLDLFSIGTIVVPTHIEPIPKPICILDIIMVKPILKQHVVPIDVLAMKLAIPPNTILDE